MRGKGTNLLFASVVLLAAAPVLNLLGAAPDPVEGSSDLGLPQVSYLAAGVAAIITGLQLLLYLYRRRAYILWWTAGWGSLAASLACAGRSAPPTKWGLFLLGAAQLLAVVSATLFFAGGNAYQSLVSLRRRYLWAALPLGLWLLLAPLALGPVTVRSPGYLLTAAVLTVAGGAHILILRSTGLLGAGVVGTMLVVEAITHVWRAVPPDGSAAQALGEAFLVDLALYLVTALGMQLMTFEDMTGELRRANTQLETAQTELRQLVMTDALTGCRNRRFFDEIIAHELNLHRRYGTPLSLLFVDIDYFKAINDTLGHAAGDKVLREVASYLVRKTRDADYVFRWGGDEFLLLVSCREDEAQRRGLELQLDFSRLPSSAGLPRGVGLSFGCAEVSPFADTALDALKLADERMYVNKRSIRLPSPQPV